MKKIIQMSGRLLLIMTIILSITLTCTAQKKATATPIAEGSTTKTYFENEPITGLRIYCRADITLNKSDKTSIITEVGNNLDGELIVTKDINGVVTIELRVDQSKRQRPYHERVNQSINIIANVGDISQLKTGNSCRLTARGVFGGSNLEIGMSGGSEIRELNLNVTNKLTIGTSGSSKINAKIGCDIMNVDTSGSSNIDLKIDRCTQMSFDLSGSSTLFVKPTTNDVYVQTMNIDTSGSSDVNVKDIEVKNGTFDMSGSSSVNAWITETMNVHISGGSTFYYKGSPRIPEISASGSSKLRQM